MGRPRKEQTQVSEEQPPVQAETPEPVAAKTPEAPKEAPKVPAGVKALQEKKAAEEAAKEAFLDALDKVSEEYSKGPDAPRFVPVKDRDGKIVPGLILGSILSEKRDPFTQELRLDKNREVQKEWKASVWVFSNASEPHRATYTIPE